MTPPADATLYERLRSIELLAMDVDGVLTDGGLIYDAHGQELKVFHVRDGFGMKVWHEAGKLSAIVTGRKSGSVEKRAAELGISDVHQGVANKGSVLRELQSKHRLTLKQTCFVGDDVPDLEAFAQAGLAVAVADACLEVVAASHYVTKVPGGRGALRETIELILRAQGKWRVAGGHLPGPGV